MRLWILAALTTLAPLSIDIYTPSLPAIEAEFGVSEWLAQVSITTCLLGIGVGQVVWGPLSDRFGRKPVVLIGIAGWTLFSGLTAWAPDAIAFVLVRVVAGLCGAACIVTARSIVRDTTPDAGLRAARIGMLSLVSAAAPVVAPVLGALVAAAWGWRADFLALAAAGAVLLAVFGVAVPETLPPAARSAGAGAAGGLRTALRDRELVVVALSLAAFAFGFYAYIGAASFIVERELGYPPVVFAVVFAANATAMVVANLACRRLVRRYPPRRLLGVGLLGSCTGGLLLLLTATSGAPGWALWVASMVFAASAGFVLPSAHAAGQATVVVSGAASAVTGAAQFLSGVLGSPATGVLGVSAIALGAVILASSGVGLVVWQAGLGKRPIR